MSPADRELLLQTPRFETWVVGAKANVLTALALLGQDTSMVSAVPNDASGDAAVRTLRGHCVDTRAVQRRSGRMRLYFVTSGAGLCATDVIYDRGHSAFVTAPHENWGWETMLAGAARLHLFGTTPALETGDCVRGITISFDGNYRARLWAAWDRRPRETLHALVAQVDVMFGNCSDIALLLDERFAAAPERVAAEAAFAAFPKLTMLA